MDRTSESTGCGAACGWYSEWFGVGYSTGWLSGAVVRWLSDFVFGCCRTSTVNVFNALVFHVLICRLVNPMGELEPRGGVALCGQRMVVCLELISGA